MKRQDGTYEFSIYGFFDEHIPGWSKGFNWNQNSRERLKFIELNFDRAILEMNKKHRPESDARERAVRALRKSCADNENGYCAVSRVIGDDGYPSTMFCGYKCDTVKDFIKHYDNDSKD